MGESLQATSDPEVQTTGLMAVVRDRVLARAQIAYLVAPFVSAAALESLLHEWEGTAILLTSWRADHLRSGAADLGIFAVCRRHDVALYVLDSLHAKLYSADLTSGWLGSANLTLRALGVADESNDEVLTLVDPLPMSTRVWVHGLLGRAELVNDDLYAWYSAWVREFTNTGRSPLPSKPPREVVDPYLLNRLPAVESPSRLFSLLAGTSIPRDTVEQHGLEHDLGLFDLAASSTPEELNAQLRPAFLGSAFSRSLDAAIPPAGMRFGAVKQWLQSTCTDVPVPYRRDLTVRVQTLYNWLTQLAPDRYQIAIPGRRSQVLCRVSDRNVRGNSG